MSFFIDSALLGVQYALLAIGVYLSFRIMNIPDLTVDGSFTFGMAVSAILTVNGHPFLGLLLSLLVGALAGFVTGFLHTIVKIPAILAGILTMTGLYTVNITVLGGPNVSLLTSDKFFNSSMFGGLNVDTIKIIFAPLLTVLVIILLALFFKTTMGLSIRATGNNEKMVKASSINTTSAKIIALALSNAMVGLCGGLICQYQGFADISSGSGMIIIGLASVIIGEAIFGKRSVTIGLISAAVGSIVYRILIALALTYNIISTDALKLLSAVIVAITLAIPAIKKFIYEQKIKRENMKNA